MGKVFVVQVPKRRNPSWKPGDAEAEQWLEYNITPASAYGALQPPLFNGGGAEFSTAPAVSRVLRALKDYNDDDSILANGDPAAIALVCAIAAQQNRGCFAILRWDRLTRQYVRLVFNTRPGGKRNDAS